MRIRKGDLVKIISGVVAARTPPQEQPARRVLQVLDGGEKVVVEGVNLVYKHVKRGHPKSPQGGRLRLEMPIHSSNVMFVCPSCNAMAKLGMRFSDDGAKERFCKKCNASAGQISPARVAHAAKK
ncbi:MAG: 50S ribosomal protein L24 [Planctomycetaceae bacterium]|nr:50S ribosomal protein L24 [Planctomycetaceae bacterium]